MGIRQTPHGDACCSLGAEIKMRRQQRPVEQPGSDGVADQRLHGLPLARDQGDQLRVDGLEVATVFEQSPNPRADPIEPEIAFTPEIEPHPLAAIFLQHHFGAQGHACFQRQDHRSDREANAARREQRHSIRPRGTTRGPETSGQAPVWASYGTLAPELGQASSPRRASRLDGWRGPQRRTPWHWTWPIPADNRECPTFVP